MKNNDGVRQRRRPSVRPSVFAGVIPQLALAGLLLLALALGAVAVAGGLSRQPASPSTPPVLHWANEGISDLYTLDPAKQPDFNARQALQLIYGGLVRFGPGFQLLPDVAQSWQVSGDNRTYTFIVRSGIRFGDGSQLTAQDVAYSLNRALSPALAPHAGGIMLSDIDGAAAVIAGKVPAARGIRVIDGRTIRLTLRRPSASFLAKLTNPPAFIVDRRAIASNPRTWDQRPIGTGPFKVARWIHNNALLLVPNQHYYGGAPPIGGIDMPFVSEPLTAYHQYRTGSIDLVGSVHFPTEVLSDVQGQPDFHETASLETVYLTLNLRTRPFNDVRVRQAFAHALNKSDLVTQAYSGFGRPTDRMIPPGLPGYAPPLSGLAYDPALARKLMAMAGYPDGRGFPTIVYPVDQFGQRTVLADALANQWKRVLKVRVRPVLYSHTAYLNLLQRLQFQIALIDWTADYPDPENFLRQLLHSGVPNNNGGWSNPTFDRLTDTASAMRITDPARTRRYHQAEQIALHAGAAIPLYNPDAGILLRSSVRGLSFSSGYVLARDWSKVTVASGAER